MYLKINIYLTGENKIDLYIDSIHSESKNNYVCLFLVLVRSKFKTQKYTKHYNRKWNKKNKIKIKPGK